MPAPARVTSGAARAMLAPVPLPADAPPADDPDDDGPAAGADLTAPVPAGTRRQRALRDGLRLLAPHLPLLDARDVLARAGRPAMRALAPDAALWLALTSHARHRATDYDALLAEGYDRDSARHFTLDATNDALRAWGCAREVRED